MTMLVLLSHKNNVILAADKREVFFHDEINFDVLSDNVTKIVDWKGGYITGSGYVPLLEKIKNIASLPNTWSYDDIVYELQNELTRGNYHPHWIKTTTFAAIFQTSSGFRAVYTQAQDIKAFCIPEGSCLILVNKVETSSFKQNFNSLLSKDVIDIKEIIDSLEELFNYASRCNGTVSSEFDFAIINGSGKAFTTIS